MKNLILVLTLCIGMFLVQPAKAFEVGNLKWTNFAEFYAADEYNLHRVELSSKIKYKKWDGYVKVKAFADIDNDFSSLEGMSQVKFTYVHPVFKGPFNALVQYVYTDRPKNYDETVRFGVGVRF